MEPSEVFFRDLPFHNSKNILTLPKPIAEQPLALQHVFNIVTAFKWLLNPHHVICVVMNILTRVITMHYCYDMVDAWVPSGSVASLHCTRCAWFGYTLSNEGADVQDNELEYNNGTYILVPCLHFTWYLLEEPQTNSRDNLDTV